MRDCPSSWPPPRPPTHPPWRRSTSTARSPTAAASCTGSAPSPARSVVRTRPRPPRRRPRPPARSARARPPTRRRRRCSPRCSRAARSTTWPRSPRRSPTRTSATRCAPEVVARLAEHLDRGHARRRRLGVPLPVRREDRERRSGAHGAAATDLAVGARRLAHGPLRRGELPGRGEAAQGPRPPRRARRAPTRATRPLYAYGNSRGDLRLLGRRGPTRRRLEARSARAARAVPEARRGAGRLL